MERGCQQNDRTLADGYHHLAADGPTPVGHADAAAVDLLRDRGSRRGVAESDREAERGPGRKCGHQLAGGDRSRCPELESRTTPHNDAAGSDAEHRHVSACDVGVQCRHGLPEAGLEVNAVCVLGDRVERKGGRA